jgi:hypothetical protein
METATYQTLNKFLGEINSQEEPTHTTLDSPSQPQINPPKYQWTNIQRGSNLKKKEIAQELRDTPIPEGESEDEDSELSENVANDTPTGPCSYSNPESVIC